MKYYFVAQIKIHSNNEYQKYLDKVDEVFSRYKGRYLAVDNSPVQLEGKCDYSKFVIIEFQSKLCWCYRTHPGRRSPVAFISVYPLPPSSTNLQDVFLPLLPAAERDFP